MASPGNAQPKIGRIVRTILLAALITVLPGLQWSLFGWVHIFLPLLAFYLMGSFGGYTGKRLLLVAVATALPVYLLMKNWDLFIFSSTLLLTGYVLFISAERHDPPALSGLKGAFALTMGWIVVLALLSIGSDISAYGQLVRSLDEGIAEAIDFYRQSADISADTLVILESTLPDEGHYSADYAFDSRQFCAAHHLVHHGAGQYAPVEKQWKSALDKLSLLASAGKTYLAGNRHGNYRPPAGPAVQNHRDKCSRSAEHCLLFSGAVCCRFFHEQMACPPAAKIIFLCYDRFSVIWNTFPAHLRHSGCLV